MMRWFRALVRAKDGATLVEFAFVAPVFMMLLVGVFDIGHTVYVRSVLEGAVQKAGRDAGIEDASANLDDIDDYVRSQVSAVVPTGEFTFNRLNYREFGDVGVGEEIADDKNKNGYVDSGDCWWNIDDNTEWDEKGSSGLGGAKDIVLYTATVEYDYFFPLWKFIGGSERAKLSATTTLRSQPFGSQATRTPVKMCEP